jgi:clan AA aspartic protease
MGLTDVKLVVSNPAAPRKRVAARFLVDSGATYSVLPDPVWRKLGLREEERMEFSLADATTVSRGLSEARFHFQGRARSSPVILGNPGDQPLLGAVTLETLGLVLNPLRRELSPIRAMLAFQAQSTAAPPASSEPMRRPRGRPGSR